MSHVFNFYNRMKYLLKAFHAETEWMFSTYTISTRLAFPSWPWTIIFFFLYFSAVFVVNYTFFPFCGIFKSFFDFWFRFWYYKSSTKEQVFLSAEPLDLIHLHLDEWHVAFLSHKRFYWSLQKQDDCFWNVIMFLLFYC